MKLQIDVLTLFPEMFQGPFEASLLGRARNNGLINIKIHNLRDFSKDKHRKVDDKPFGGGAGMVIGVEPLYNALKALGALKKGKKKPYVVFLSPQGQPWSQKLAQEYSEKSSLILICGHYEGIDERAMQWIDAEASIGDYVLTGGEIPAMVLVDTIARLVPGVVKEKSSVENDSFSNTILDFSHYTRPADFMGAKVPEVLLSGNHEKVREWRTRNARENTAKKRPDLLKGNLDIKKTVR